MHSDSALSSADVSSCGSSTVADSRGWLDRLGISPGDRALAWKELRETFPIFVGALALYAVYFGVVAFDVFGRPSGYIDMWYVPFVRDEAFDVLMLWLSGATAVALGLRQTLVESFAGTYPLLFHYPLGRRRAVGIKMLVGAGVYLLSGAIVIGGYGAWAATPGTHPGPFEWSMTLPFWGAHLALGLLYFGTFSAGLRPARWYGSRWWPVAGAAVATICSVAPFPWGPLGFIASLACLVGACLFVAERREC